MEYWEEQVKNLDFNKIEKTMYEYLEKVNQLTYYAPFIKACIRSPYFNDIAGYYGENIPRIFEYSWHEYQCDQNNNESKPDLNELSQQYQMLVTSLEFEYKGKQITRSELACKLSSEDKSEQSLARRSLNKAFLDHANDCSAV